MVDHTSALPHVTLPTGSIVLDTVREYTKAYPHCVLLVQVGDFYELYESHATHYAAQLDLKLTKKAISAGHVVDFAGFPVRALDRYLDILVNRLQCKVALCEQLGPVSRQDQSTLGMQRRITRVLTPGTVIEERFLEPNQYNYLLAIYPQDEWVGLAWVDVSVGEFVMQQTALSRLKDDLARIRPREVILPESMQFHSLDQMDDLTRLVLNDASITISYQPDSQFNAQLAAKTLHSMFHHRLPDFSPQELSASRALMMYVNQTHVHRKPKWQRPTQFSLSDNVLIDSAAMNSLELVKSLQGKRTDSLLSVLDKTCTSAGSRLLTRWISSPLTHVVDIQSRLNIVDYFVQDKFLLQDIRSLLRSSTDAQRAIQRLALKKGHYADLVQVGYTLDVMHQIHQKLASVLPLQDVLNDMDPHVLIAEYISGALDHDKIQGNTKDYGYINHNFHPDLVSLHHLLSELEQQKLALETELKSICGPSIQLVTEGPLKHLIEVNARQARHLLDRFTDAVPLNHTKAKKRFAVDTWTDISIQLDSVQSQIMQVESQVFDQMVDHVLDHSASILLSCRQLAQLDVLTCFAHLAIEHNYVKPRITRTHRTLIQGGRHPVVEANLAKKGQSFIRNDCDIGHPYRIWLLTGPNMGGKSTFLRQHAIIVIMAHMGSFVPADRAWIGVTDKVFSRVGAADNLAQNQSTFMVEMSEVATILDQATAKSTVIMDEVGRGTSTQDGFSLAYGILDYLHQHIQCRTLFATHYHELAAAMEDYASLGCYHTRLEENKHGFRFVHQVEPGVCRQSHGLKVAQLAGKMRWMCTP
ncbi:DNA mismatch repair protein MutS [Gilbertella persicaria]|uniref:DNA mismatch repair protein MutS n=1 Tax=Gilbertella persicaria TaxID=101096 RepID=UPI002220432F|nr:DNA mismatch repair protein MutS [Gilbertella persicaria]KAI8063435.1 DNA mismatch repair protein MutS [Gilbertella persicaria]